MSQCTGRKPCLKEINPEDYPDVYTGEPWVFDPSCGECVDCIIERSLRQDTQLYLDMGGE